VTRGRRSASSRLYYWRRTIVIAHRTPAASHGSLRSMLNAVSSPLSQQARKLDVRSGGCEIGDRGGLDSESSGRPELSYLNGGDSDSGCGVGLCGRKAVRPWNIWQLRGCTSVLDLGTRVSPRKRSNVRCT
jgi:hypothetical protein